MPALIGTGAYTQDAADAVAAAIGSTAQLAAGNQWFVSTTGNDSNVGTSMDTAFRTVAFAVASADPNDQILIAPGEYAESVTISTAKLTLIGLGGRGAVFVAPTTANPTAITVNGVDDITLINVGAEGDGTGGGLNVTAGSSRFRAYGCKFEGGAFAAKLQSTAAGAPGDTRFGDCEFAWSTTGLHLELTGGGDPVTQTLVQDSLFHNLTTDGVLADQVSDLWLIRNVFANQEDGTEPTQYLDLDTASTTGLVAYNVFATTVLATGKLAIAAGVIWCGNQTQAEGAATGGGTSGRPD